jgi:hypothetical protein
VALSTPVEAACTSVSTHTCCCCCCCCAMYAHLRAAVRQTLQLPAPSVHPPLPAAA